MTVHSPPPAPPTVLGKFFSPFAKIPPTTDQFLRPLVWYVCRISNKNVLHELVEYISLNVFSNKFMTFLSTLANRNTVFSTENQHQ